MERVLTNLCSFVDSRVLSKLNNSILTPNTLYSEVFHVFDNDVFSNTCGLKTKYNTTKEIERV